MNAWRLLPLIPLLGLPVASGGCGNADDVRTADCSHGECDATDNRNPVSTRIPDGWIDLARASEIVVVAGANAGSIVEGMREDGRGSADRPFVINIQAIEAAAALLQIADPGRDTIHAWGFGDSIEPEQTYYYLALTGKLYQVHFLNTDAVGPAYVSATKEIWKYLESECRNDATRLAAAVGADKQLDGHQVLFVAHSWGAAIVDYGITRTDATGAPILTNPAIALGSPRELPSTKLGWPFVRLSDNGDFGDLFMVRRPDDPVGKGGIWTLGGVFGGARHNYAMVYQQAGPNAPKIPGGFWGVSGPGMLCSAMYPDNCPEP